MRNILFVICLIGLFACSGQQAMRPVGEVDPAKKTIMIAVLKGAESSYKTALIDAIRKDFGSEYNIQTVTVKKFKDLSGQKYDALVVMEQLKAWLFFNGGLKSIVKQADKNTSVFLITAGDPKWRWNRKDLMHITSASQKEKPARIYPELRVMLNKALDGKQD